MRRPIRVAILGASGYGAGELLRLLVAHPAAEVVSVISTSQAGAAIGDVHPHLRGFYDELRIADAVDFDRLSDAEHSVIFSALPHGASAAAIAGLLSSGAGSTASEAAPADPIPDPRSPLPGLRIIDLSGDFRLADVQQHERFYPESPTLPDLRASFVYGLPEIIDRGRIRSARLISNPGCLATAAILAAAPLMDADFRGPIAIDAKTGSSGSGRTLKEGTHHPTRHANFLAYRPLAHQHEPEILQAWGDPTGERIAASFVAQSMDAARGIFVTCHLTLPRPSDGAALAERYRRFYAASPFVRVVEGSPALQNVVGSNFCDVAVAARGRQVIAMAALDNLVKGMAGTAIQNMNLMCGLKEAAGLWTPAFRPV